ncbi:MAG: PTS sugar transporter subunit IIA [Acidobacteriota bacterium]|nr:PTS sugar transporter subunit IIA [Thermoanaerobaculaceae bacterium]
MDTILDALQEGRLFELPENDKTDSLQFLAHIIEAFPEVPAGTDIVGLVMNREQATNTALGQGWACPHARVPFEEDLMCVIGWSPSGINYGAKDEKPVRLVIMYLVPANQLNHYLREISILAKALQAYPETHKLETAKDLNDVRNYILDLVAATKETVGPDARARMIRLHAAPALETFTISDLSNIIVEPVTLICTPNFKVIALTQNGSLAEYLESSNNIIEKLESDGYFQNGGWRVIRRTISNFPGGKAAYDCLAIKLAKGQGTQR